MPFSALLDSCVLYPNALRDTLLRIAEAGIYQPLWSERILAEVRGALVRKGLAESRVDRTLSFVRNAFPEAIVEGWERLEDAMGNHAKDRHVLAAAVRGHADVIVTFNLRDFPQSVCSPLDIEVQHPDTFLCYELEQAPAAIQRILMEQAAGTGKLPHPRLTVSDVLAALENCGAPVFAAMVRSRFNIEGS